MCESRSAAAGANSLLAGQKGCSLLKTEVIINQETRAAGGSAKVTRKSASSDLTALLTKFLLGLYQALMRSQWAPAYFYFCNTWRSYRNALERLVTKFSLWYTMALSPSAQQQREWRLPDDQAQDSTDFLGDRGAWKVAGYIIFQGRGLIKLFCKRSGSERFRF